MPATVLIRQGAGPRRAGRRLRALGRALALAALLLLVVLYYWKLGLTRQYTWLESDDLAYQVLPWLKYQTAEWRRGHLPLWDPNHWGGQSLIGQAQPGTAYPLNWILFSLPWAGGGGIRFDILNWYFIAIHAMAVLFAYWLCRDLGRSRFASAAGGCVFGLGSFLGTVTWPQMMNGTVWIPLVFLFLLRAGRGYRPWSSAALSGAFAGIAWLGGHHQVPIFTAVVACGMWLFFFLRSAGAATPNGPDSGPILLRAVFRAGLRTAALAAIWAVFLFLAGALQILPAFEYGHLALRWVSAEKPVGWNDPVPYSVHTQFSLGPSALLGVLVPGIVHARMFVGVVAAALALTAVVARWRNRWVRIFSAVAAAGFLLALGRFNVFHGILYTVLPMMEKARTPAFAIVLFQFGAAVLVAFGFDSLPAAGARLRTPEAVRMAKRVALGLAVAGGLLYAGSFAILLANRLQFPFDDRVVMTAAFALIAAGLVAAAARGALSRRALAVCAGGLLLIELSTGTDFVYMPRAEAQRLKKYTANQDVVDFLRRQPGQFRVDVDFESISYNFGDWHEIDQYNGYMASLPANVVRAGELVPNRAQLYGVQYTVTRRDAPAGTELVFEAAGGMKVYRHPNPFPRVWTVHRVAPMDGDRVHGTPDLRAEAFVPGRAPLVDACSGTDEVRMTGRTSGRVNIVANMACKGMVIVSENFFPGWKAAVDGEPAEIYAADLSLRGIVVPAGQHRIDMVYRPASVIAGAILTAAGLLLAAALAVWEARRQASV